MAELRASIRAFIRAQPHAAELHWLLFSSALRSFKRDFLLKPFPPLALDADGQRDFAKLDAVAAAIPRLRRVDVEELSEDAVALLHWVFFEQSFSVSVVTGAEEKRRIMRLPNSDPGQASEPTLCFRVTPSEASEAAFSTAAGDFPRRFAFHGSRLPNFHSIANHGLLGSLNKTALFGEGTYLGLDLGLSLNWSPQCAVGGSGLGARFSAVAVAEVALDPAGVASGSDTSRGLPERYLLARGDDLVQLRFLLVYAERGAEAGRGRDAAAWVRRHWAVVLVLLYVCLLLAASAANSDVLRRVSASLFTQTPPHAASPYDDA